MQNLKIKLKKLIVKTDIYKRIAAILFDYNYKTLFGTSKTEIIKAEKIIMKDFKIIWVGINENSDRSGLLQGLKETFKTKVYRNKNNEYGVGNNSIYDQKKIDHNSKLFLNDIIEEVENKRVDAIIGQFMGININIITLKKIRDMGVKVISLSWDDKLTYLWRNDYKKSCHSISSQLDFVLCSSMDALPKYKNALFFPLGSSKEIFYSDTESFKEIDILFVGNNYGYRKIILQYLVNKGFKIECYGNGFDNGFIDFEKAAEKFKNSKIILGIGYVSHSKKITTLKLRDFDSMISGALYITSYNYELNHLFNNIIPTYNNLKDLNKTLNYYLKNKRERLKLAKYQQEEILNKYEWRNLFNRLKY